MSDPVFNVWRFVFKGEPRLMASGLTRAEAVEWCSDPETSSTTAKGGPGSRAGGWETSRTPWFDGWREA